MKKIILAVMLSGFALGAYAQGTISFQNATIAPKVYTNNMQGASGLAKQNQFHVALYWGDLNASTDAQMVSIFNGVGSAADGMFYFATAITTPAGTAPGADAHFQVRGWTGNFSTYEAAVASGTAFVGASAIFTNPTGGAGSPPGVAKDLTGWTGNLILSPIPEPSTIALAGLGAASLLLFRRRK